MRSLVLLLLLALACGDDDGAPDASDPADAPEGPVPFRVLTWNVENLFDDVDDPDKIDDVPSPAQVSAKLEELAVVLRLVNADFVALQEVENQAILDALADEVPELGYESRGLIDSFDGRGIDVAFMTRVPLASSPMVTSHQGERFPLPDGSDEIFFTRDALEVFVEVNQVTLGVVILHLRSMRDGGAEIREAEATYTHRIVEQRVESGLEHMLVVGDLNDDPGSGTYDALVGDDRLQDLTLSVPSDDRWTFVFDRTRRQFDYQLASAGMAEFFNEGTILHGDEVDDASDHQPVAMDFLIRR
jgi:endonuclease/exonuclease/phosphatase family metal-dependent hydrolase